MADRTLEQILSLAPVAQVIAFEFINRARTELQLPAVIQPLGGRRTLSQQRKLLAQGRTTTLRSKHVDGLAFDVDMYGWNRDDVPRWAYDALGDLAHEMGLVWGGDWTSFVDIGHFEI